MFYHDVKRHTRRGCGPGQRVTSPGSDTAVIPSPPTLPDVPSSQVAAQAGRPRSRIRPRIGSQRHPPTRPSTAQAESPPLPELGEGGEGQPWAVSRVVSSTIWNETIHRRPVNSTQRRTERRNGATRGLTSARSLRSFQPFPAVCRSRRTSFARRERSGWPRARSVGGASRIPRRRRIVLDPCRCRRGHQVYGRPAERSRSARGVHRVEEDTR